MSKQYLIESFTVDCATEIKKRTDLMESLDNGKIKGTVWVEKSGKLIQEASEFDVLGVYDVPISRPGFVNKNKRKYTLERTWSPVLEKKLGEGSIGLLNHPDQGKSPDITKAACVWRNHRVAYDENKNPIIRADMFLLKDKRGNGDLVESIINAGGKVDLSTRGYGEIDPLGEVYNYDYKATDIVYEGSYGVQVSKDQRYSEDKVPTLKESLLSKVMEPNKKIEISEGQGVKNPLNSTNNKEIQGELQMNKVVIKRLMGESVSKENKFKAYVELNELAESIKADENLKDEFKQIQEEIKKIQPLLEAEYQGDADDNGSADTDNKGLDPEKKIKDTDEEEPEDIQGVQVDDVSDTTDADREEGAARPYKPGSGKGSMDYEVMSGNISHKNVGIKEDSDEEEPEDVNPVDVDDVEDTDDRSAYTDMQAGGGGEVSDEEPSKDDEEIEKLEAAELKKMSKGELVAVVEYLNEATKALQDKFSHERKLFDVLSEQYLKLESYTLKAEKVVEMDKGFKEKAQAEVTEAVDYVKQSKAEYDAILEKIEQQQTYIVELENMLENSSQEQADKNDVEPWVNEALLVNPHLTPFEKELKRSGSIHEARELMSKYSAMKGKVRMDQVLTEDEAVDNAKQIQAMDEGASYLQKKGWI